MTAGGPPAPALAAAVIRQALAPMAVFYLVLMAALGLGLLGLRRGGPGRGGPGAFRDRRGWPAFARQVLPTVLGGYLLLLVVATAYYYLVARVGGAFLSSAVTGTALLMGVTMPVYAALAWLAAKSPGRAGKPPGR